MQKLMISNVKNAEYKDVNLNTIYEPNTQHKHSFEFQKCNVSNSFAEGEGKLSVNFYTLQPGKANYPYHYHTGNEEVFYIIRGQGTLKSPEGEKAVSEGDVIVLPANENGAHMLINTSKEPLIYLDVHTLSSPEVILYPDSGNIRVVTGEMQKSFKMESEVNYLDGE